MKKLLLILLCLPLFALAQQTYVPDNWFEAYLENNGMGNGIQYDDSVFTAAIDTVTYLDLSYGAGQAIGIFDLTGIEDFIALEILYCGYNLLTSIDISNNLSLSELDCAGNQLTSLDVSQNTNLNLLDCAGNQLTSLDVSQNIALTFLECAGNQLTSLNISNNTDINYLHCAYNQLMSLDVSNNINLITLNCGGNQFTTLDLSYNIYLADLYCGFNQYLTALNIQNGNNINLACDGVMGYLCVENCPNLNCIQVDDDVWSNFNWIMSIDTTYQYFSVNCNPISIQEHNIGVNILRVVDITGREVNRKQNIPLFYIYNDGIVEKKIILD